MVRPLSQRNLSHFLGRLSCVPLRRWAPHHPEAPEGPAALPSMGAAPWLA